MKQKFPLIYFTVLVALLTIGLAILPSHSGHYMKYEMRRGFDQDPSCVLNLKFYQQGAESTRIIDHSGNNNHGTITGAVPATYPLLSGVELVTNGGMESEDPPTGWFNSGLETFERSAVQKHSGSYSVHGLDSTPNYGNVRQYTTTATGKRYKLSFWYYVVSGSISGQLYDSSGSTSVCSNYGLTGASWQYAESYGTQILGGSDCLVTFGNISGSVPAEFYIDDVSVQEVVGSQGLGWGFDGVDDNINCGAGSSLDLTTDYTMLIWAKGSPISSTGKILIGKVEGGTYKGIALRLTGYSDGSPGMMQFHYVGVTADKSHIFSTANYFDNTWRCFGIIVSVGATAKAYMNGVQVDSDFNCSGAGSVSMPATSLLIGDWDLDTARHLQGQVGEVLIFNRALSAQEIRNYFELTRRKYGSDARDILAEYAEEFEYAMAA